MNPLDMIAVYATVAMLGAALAVVIVAALRRPHCKVCAYGEPSVPAWLDQDDPLVRIIRRSEMRPCVKVRQYQDHAARLAAGAVQAAPKGRPLTGTHDLTERQRIQFDAMRERRQGVRR